MKKYILSLFIIASASASSYSQSLAINTDGSVANSSSILDIKATGKGILIPRMTTLQRTAIAGPATGLLVFDTDFGSFWYYDGATWKNVNVLPGWSLIGNSGTVEALIS